MIIRFVPNDAQCSGGPDYAAQERTTAAQHNTTQPSTAAIRFAIARKPIIAPAHHVSSYKGCREAADCVKYLRVCVYFCPAV